MTSPPPTTISAVILAAGGSSRMGRSKPLLRFGGEPLVRRLARRVLAAAVDETLIVVGAHAEEVAAAVADLPLRITENPNWQLGQSASVATAVGALSPTAGAALFIPCDLPHLTPEVLRALLSAYRHGNASIVVPMAGGLRRSPVLIGSSLFPELLELTGDRGARQIFSAHADDLLEIPIADARALDDIDTWEDYERLASEGS